MDRIQIYNKCQRRCAYCGTQLTIEEMTVDHVIPICKHGEIFPNETIVNYPENHLPSCKDCNNAKSMHLLEDFRALITNSDKLKVRRKLARRVAAKVHLLNERANNKGTPMFFFEIIGVKVRLKSFP